MHLARGGERKPSQHCNGGAGTAKEVKPEKTSSQVFNEKARKCFLSITFFFFQRAMSIIFKTISLSKVNLKKKFF